MRRCHEGGGAGARRTRGRVREGRVRRLGALGARRGADPAGRETRVGVGQGAPGSSVSRGRWARGGSPGRGRDRAGLRAAPGVPRGPGTWVPRTRGTELGG